MSVKVGLDEFYFDHGDGVKYHHLFLLEKIASVAYLNLFIVKRE